MMSTKGAGAMSLFISRLAFIPSAMVVLRFTRYASNVTAHYLSSLDRRVIFGWDKHMAGDQSLLQTRIRKQRCHFYPKLTAA